MFIFELIITLLLIGAILSLIARRIGIPYPALLALAGAVHHDLKGRYKGVKFNPLIV